MTVPDILAAVGTLLMLCGAIFFGALFTQEFQTAALESGHLEGDAAQALVKTRDTIRMFNWMFPFILVGLYIVMLVSAYFIYTHPIYMVLSIVALVFVVIITGAFTDMFNQFAGHEAFTGVIGDFTIIVTAWQNMPFIALVMGISVIIVMFAKWRSMNVPQQ